MGRVQQHRASVDAIQTSGGPPMQTEVRVEKLTIQRVIRIYSPPASRGFTRRGGGASITIIPAEREDSAGFYIVWVENVLVARAQERG